MSFFVLSSVPATSSLLPPDLSSDLLSLPFFICRLHGPTRTSKETSSPSSRISDRVESSERSISSSLRVSKPSFHLPLPLFTNTRTALAIPLSLLPRLSPSKFNFQTHRTDSLPLSPSLHSSLSLSLPLPSILLISRQRPPSHRWLQERTRNPHQRYPVEAQT